MARAQLTIEMDETELARLSEAARKHDVHLDNLTTAQFVQLVAEVTPALSKKPSREMRRAAIASVHGLWKNDPDKQQDGLEYQREVRAAFG
jgi:hypothetical protein